MDKIYNISIVLSLLGLWITSIVPKEYEIVLGFILIFSFGILHGSNDILLIENLSNKKTKQPFFKVFALYLITVLSAVILFYYLPAVAFLLFIVFSAFHFGEQHWEHKITINNSLIIKFFYLFYGLFILFLLFFYNAQKVIEVIYSITSYSFAEEIIIYGLIASTLLLIVFAIKLRNLIINFKSVFFKELFYLIVFAIVFKASTLIWGFTIYFILWHSIPSLYEQINFIYGNYNKTSVISYFKRAFPYWIISLIGIVIVISIFKEEKLIYAILFSFIAAITFPHALVINKMFKNQKTQSK
ncbi:Brp/Blh family beta-carotene 15,15'-dioxygenase [Olleya aquimaris]|nr:Brp/Blh family beta-carotene 15,15'-dioxygenase [Olleya aquimaris]